MVSPSSIVRQTIARYELPIRLSITKLWDAQRKELPLSQIKKNRDIPIDTIQIWERQYYIWFTELMQPVWTRVWNQSNIIIYETLFKIDTQSLYDSYIEQRGSMFTASMVNAQLGASRLIIKEGSNRSWSWTANKLKDTVGMQPRSIPRFLKLSEKIRKDFPPEIAAKKIARMEKQLINYRAQLIARTETSQALNEAQFRNTSNLVQEGKLSRVDKLWDTVGDNRVSDGCQDNAANGAIRLEQEFSSGHLHPTRFPGCRCGVSYVPIGGRVYAIPRMSAPKVSLPKRPGVVAPTIRALSSAVAIKKITQKKIIKRETLEVDE